MLDSQKHSHRQTRANPRQTEHHSYSQGIYKRHSQNRNKDSCQIFHGNVGTMFSSISQIIAELEGVLREKKACHQMRASAADQEMLHELTVNNCIDEENCTFPNCSRQEKIIKDCLSRWRRREVGELTENDRIFLLYYILSKVYGVG